MQAWLKGKGISSIYLPLANLPVRLDVPIDFNDDKFEFPPPGYRRPDNPNLANEASYSFEVERQVIERDQREKAERAAQQAEAERKAREEELAREAEQRRLEEELQQLPDEIESVPSEASTEATLASEETTGEALGTAQEKREESLSVEDHLSEPLPPSSTLSPPKHLESVPGRLTEGQPVRRLSNYLDFEQGLPPPDPWETPSNDREELSKVLGGGSVTDPTSLSPPPPPHSTVKLPPPLPQQQQQHRVPPPVAPRPASVGSFPAAAAAGSDSLPASSHSVHSHPSLPPPSLPSSTMNAGTGMNRGPVAPHSHPPPLPSTNPFDPVDATSTSPPPPPPSAAAAPFTPHHVGAIALPGLSSRGPTPPLPIAPRPPTATSGSAPHDPPSYLFSPPPKIDGPPRPRISSAVLSLDYDQSNSSSNSSSNNHLPPPPPILHPKPSSVAAAPLPSQLQPSRPVLPPPPPLSSSSSSSTASLPPPSRMPNGATHTYGHVVTPSAPPQHQQQTVAALSPHEQFVRSMVAAGFSRKAVEAGVQVYGMNGDKVTSFAALYDHFTPMGFHPSMVTQAVHLCGTDRNMILDFLDGHQRLKELGFPDQQIVTALALHNFRYQEAIEELIKGS